MSFSRASQQTLRQAVKAVAPKASKQVAQRSYSLLSRQAPAAMMASRLGVSRTVLFISKLLMKRLLEVSRPSTLPVPRRSFTSEPTGPSTNSRSESPPESHADI